jgi:hypothetical protein
LVRSGLEGETMKRSLVGLLATLVLFSVFAVVGVSAASAQKFCTSGPGSALTVPTAGGTCKGGSVTLATNSDVAALTARVATLEAANSELQTRLAGVSRSGSTLRFNAMNVQITNGEGTTNTTNGLGNLLIGYNETPGAQTGSHNLMLGITQTFTSYGGLLAGNHNSVTAPYSSITGGNTNIASALNSVVSGGSSNHATGLFSSVSGGAANTASGIRSSISGGYNNHATFESSSVSGGSGNTAEGQDSSVSGGSGSTASGQESSVSGGNNNTAEGDDSSVSGGDNNKAVGATSSISGGRDNVAIGSFSSILGGELIEVVADYAVYPPAP